jgi:hypothetical protein
MPGIVHHDLVLHNVSRAVVNHDISIFFKHRFEEIRDKFEELPFDWPGDDTINALVQRADCLFIYAATVCRFIEEGGEQWPLDDLLRLILPDDSTTDSSLLKPSNMVITESPTKKLDKMYTRILEHSLQKVNNEKKSRSLPEYSDRSLVQSSFSLTLFLLSLLPNYSVLSKG